MKPFSSILVDVDALASAHPEFHRAVELATHYGARLKLVDVVYGTATETRGTRLERLGQLAASVPGLTVEFALLTGRPAEALIAEVNAGRHELVIHSHARDLAAHPKGIAAIEMQLFRSCPAPVWAVGIGSHHAPSSILAAVHSDSADPEQQRLNREIIDTAMLMAAPTGAAITILQAWQPYAEDMMRMHYTASEMDAYIHAAEEETRRELSSFLASYGERLAGARVELRKGCAEEAIADFAVAEGTDLVVMGTAARRGFAGLLRGNTSERLLHRLGCCLMTVKADRSAAGTPARPAGERVAVSSI